MSSPAPAIQFSSFRQNHSINAIILDNRFKSSRNWFELRPATPTQKKLADFKNLQAFLLIPDKLSNLSLSLSNLTQKYLQLYQTILT
jgi:hypothetical protein